MFRELPTVNLLAILVEGDELGVRWPRRGRLGSRPKMYARLLLALHLA